MDGREPQFENQRLLLALLLSSAVLFLTPYVFRYFYPTAEMEPAPALSQQIPFAPSEASGGVLATGEAQGVTSRQGQPPAESEVVPSEVVPTAAVSREILVESNDLILRFSNVGARPISAQLRNYRDTDKNPLELLPQSLSPELEPPFSLGVFDAAANAELAVAVYELVTPSALFGEVRAPIELTFRYQSARIEAVRKYSIPASGFLLSTITDLRLDGVPVPYRLTIGPGIGHMGSDQGGGWMMAAAGDFGFPQVAYRLDGKVERLPSVDQPQTLTIRPDWVAFDSQFFSYSTLGPGIQQVQVTGSSWTRTGPDGETLETPLISAQVEFGPGSATEFFLGPKDLDVLREVGLGLDELVDFGFFGILVEPLLFFLKSIHGVIGNYGWSIIILTFFINLVLVPIRYKQTTSMKKMSEVQPQMKAIQDRYKKLDRSDPKRKEMNAEIMGLYKKHGVNPLGGCLPLVVQMPFLFAFYQMLSSAIELREAPFMFWIADLSRPDPLWITPIVMGVTMVAQQKMMPSTGDATQRRMMMMMPIVFTIMFLNVSSGLAIYFLFSNIFGMGLQWGMGRMLKKEEIKPSSNPKGKSKKGKAAKR